MKKLYTLLLAIVLLFPAFASVKGKVYLVVGSDTSIWEGLSTTFYDGRYFLSGLYSDPLRNGYAVMDTSFRYQLRDSYGTPMKMTWWMMAGNVFDMSKNCNIPIRRNISLELMKKYHQKAIDRYDDQLTLHYHTYYWSDPEGDGTYKWVKAPEFNLNKDDYELTLCTFLIEDDVFPISFRSGWMYMDEDWQAYQERFIPFDMSDCWTNISEGSVPFHPSAENYREEGDMKQWRVRSEYFTVDYARERGLNSVFKAASEGKDQMLCLWSHLPETEFLNGMDSVNAMAHRLSLQDTVEFMYCSDVEAMRLWINPEDTIAPVLKVEEIVEGDELRFGISTDGPIFQENEPFIAIKNKYEEYIRMDCEITGKNSWETIEGIPYDDLAKVSVAVCDSVGNQAKVHLDYLYDDIFIDDRSEDFVEGAGDWSDYEGDCQLWDLSARVLSGKGDVNIVNKSSVSPDNSGKSFVPSRSAMPCAIYFHGPGSTSDSIRVMTGKDTLIIDHELLGRDKWQFVGFYEDISDLTDGITFENLDSNSNLGIDVIRITPLVADKNLVVGKDILTFGEVSVNDTASELISISNIGKEEVNVTKFSVFGSKVELGINAPFTLAPMETKEIPVTFFTDTFCEYNDVLTIETDDPRNSLKYIPIFASSTSYYEFVDNETEGYGESEGWATSSAKVWLNTSRYTYLNGRGKYADFTLNLPYSGTYDVQFIVPATTNATDHANYIVSVDGSPIDTVIIDQNENSGSWISIGEFDLPKNVPVTVRVQDNGGYKTGIVLRADAVKFTLIEEKFVSLIDHAGIPEEFKLFHNYPNPFNPSTQIFFAMPEPGKVKIDFFDLQGKMIDRSLNKHMEAGYHRLTWTPNNLSSGVYLYRISTPAGSAVGKCSFVK